MMRTLGTFVVVFLAGCGGGSTGTDAGGTADAGADPCAELCAVTPGTACESQCTMCPAARSFSATAGCTAESDALLTCAARQVDVCGAFQGTASTSCMSENAAYSTCFMAYCTANPGASGCT